MKPSTEPGVESVVVLGLVALFGIAMLAELGRHGAPPQAQNTAQREAAAQAQHAETSRAPRTVRQSNSPS